MVLDLMHKEFFCCLMIAVWYMQKIFGADMSSSAHVDNKEKNILILAKVQCKS